jgi:hypothetical protein
MRIDSSGNVGIGTSSPQDALHVYNASSLNHIKIDGPVVNRSLNFSTSGSTRWNIYANSTAEGGANSGSNLTIAKYTDAGVYNGVALFIERSSGNVGIGTTSPTEKLDVSGTVKATSYTETVYALSGTALDPANGGIQTKTLAANTTFTDSLASGESLVLQLEAGASYTVTWPTMTWVTSGGNVAPTLTAKDTLVFWKVSTTLYGAYTGSYV